MHVNQTSHKHLYTKCEKTSCLCLKYLVDKSSNFSSQRTATADSIQVLFQ